MRIGRGPATWIEIDDGNLRQADRPHDVMLAGDNIFNEDVRLQSSLHLTAGFEQSGQTVELAERTEVAVVVRIVKRDADVVCIDVTGQFGAGRGDADIQTGTQICVQLAVEGEQRLELPGVLRIVIVEVEAVKHSEWTMRQCRPQALSVEAHMDVEVHHHVAVEGDGRGDWKIVEVQILGVIPAEPLPVQQNAEVGELNVLAGEQIENTADRICAIGKESEMPLPRLRKRS